MNHDLNYLTTEYARQKMIEGYDLEMREKEAREADDNRETTKEMVHREGEKNGRR